MCSVNPCSCCRGLDPHPGLWAAQTLQRKITELVWASVKPLCALGSLKLWAPSPLLPLQAAECPVKDTDTCAHLSLPYQYLMLTAQNSSTHFFHSKKYGRYVLDTVLRSYPQISFWTMLECLSIVSTVIIKSFVPVQWLPAKRVKCFGVKTALNVGWRKNYSWSGPYGEILVPFGFLLHSIPCHTFFVFCCYDYYFYHSKNAVKSLDCFWGTLFSAHFF